MTDNQFEDRVKRILIKSDKYFRSTLVGRLIYYLRVYSRWTLVLSPLALLISKDIFLSILLSSLSIYVSAFCIYLITMACMMIKSLNNNQSND